jgi:hypothetical protein
VRTTRTARPAACSRALLGGYAFPARSQYFTPATLRATAARAGLRVERLVVRPDGRAWTSAVGHRRADVGAPATGSGRGRPPGRVADALGTLADVAAALAAGVGASTPRCACREHRAGAGGGVGVLVALSSLLPERDAERPTRHGRHDSPRR